MPKFRPWPRTPAAGTAAPSTALLGLQVFLVIARGGGGTWHILSWAADPGVCSSYSCRISWGSPSESSWRRWEHRYRFANNSDLGEPGSHWDCHFGDTPLGRLHLRVFPAVKAAPWPWVHNPPLPPMERCQGKEQNDFLLNTRHFPSPEYFKVIKFIDDCGPLVNSVERVKN